MKVLLLLDNLLQSSTNLEDGIVTMYKLTFHIPKDCEVHVASVGNKTFITQIIFWATQFTCLSLLFLTRIWLKLNGINIRIKNFICQTVDEGQI